MKSRDVIKGSLQNKGFALKSGADHFRFIYMTKSGKKTAINTKISHGSKYKMITDNLLAQMSKQCRLSKADFINLIDCPLSRDEYESKLNI